MTFIIQILALGLFWGFTTAHDNETKALFGIPLGLMMLMSLLASIN